MNEFVTGVLRLALRAVLVVMGLVLFLGRLAAALVLALAWALRAVWARLTGRPVTPWVMRIDPRTGFGTAFRSAQRWSAAAGATPAAHPAPRGDAASHRGGVLPGAGEVTDVEPRDVRPGP